MFYFIKNNDVETNCDGMVSRIKGDGKRNLTVSFTSIKIFSSFV